MAKLPPKVIGLFPPPDQDDCIEAISVALVKIRANRGLTCKDIGKYIDRCDESVRQAMAGTAGLLSFDAIARLGYYFAEEFTEVESLWLRSAPLPAPTISERLERIERELDAIRREAA